jgi:K+-sensing histidine kinase KdpD
MSDKFKANWLRRPKLRQAFGYLLAVASVGLAFVVARTFLRYHLPLAIMSFSFWAIAITFWYAGIGPGILALVLAVLIRTFFFQPEIDWISRIAYDLVFVLFSFFMLQATRAKNELEWRVAKETAALTKANEELHQEISERKRAEVALQQNVAALKNAFEKLCHSSVLLVSTWPHHPLRFRPGLGVHPNLRYVLSQFCPYREAALRDGRIVGSRRKRNGAAHLMRPFVNSDGCG